MLRLQSILNFSLKLKFASTVALYSSIKQSSGLCKIDCQRILLEIDSINVFDISVPLFLKLPAPCILESYLKVKINLNFYFHTSLWCLRRFYEGL